MDLSNLKRSNKNSSKKKRVGRGFGSGKGGHTVGRGMKGQNSRSSRGTPVGFEGGQVPLYKRLPKRSGFNNPTTKDIISVSLGYFNKFKDGQKISPKDLLETGLIKRIPKNGVKVLGNGNLHKKVEFNNFLFTQTAIEKIEKAGGSIVN